MNTQNLTNSAMICNFIVVLPEADFSSEESIYASSCDHGFDFDEEELGREILAPPPAGLSTQTIPEVDAEEFEKVFQYFFS